MPESRSNRQHCTSLVAVLMLGLPTAGLMAPISSEVDKFNLLIGSMVVVFRASAGQIVPFLLDGWQDVEFLLITAVCLFAILWSDFGQVKHRRLSVGPSVGWATARGNGLAGTRSLS